jgi:Ca2+-binding EF-hand superfamily protein
MGAGASVKDQVKQATGGEAYVKYCEGWRPADKLKALWKKIDFNGNGYVSLAEIDKLVKAGDNAGGMFEGMYNKPALMRAYKATCFGDGGDGDDWVEKKEFRAMLRNLYYFNTLWTTFDDIDTGDDRRLTEAEFGAGATKAGVTLTPEQVKEAFADIDVNGGGYVLFNEFCKFIGQICDPMSKNDATYVDFEMSGLKKIPPFKRSKRTSGAKARNPYGAGKSQDEAAAGLDRFADTEKELMEIRKSDEKLAELWKAIDFNGNGKVSLAEIDKIIVEKYPVLNNKPAMMRAYKKTTSRVGGGDGDAWVEKKEFRALIHNILYFTKVWDVFDDIDTGDDRRMDLAEFCRGVSRLKVKLPCKDLKATFATMDKNGGGQVLFDEFCKWVSTQADVVANLSVTGTTGNDQLKE